jgi:hypothetical protein
VTPPTCTPRRDTTRACSSSAQPEALNHSAGPPTEVEAIGRRAARLALRLDVVVSVIGATLTVVPPDASGPPLEDVLKAVEPAAQWVCTDGVRPDARTAAGPHRPAA